MDTLTQQHYTSTKTANFWIQDGVFYFVYKQNAKVERAADTLENFEAAVSVFAKSSNKKLPVLVDLTALRASSKINRALYARLNKNLATVVGIVAKGMFPVILGNIYLRFDKPQNPTRLFSSRDAALDWMRDVEAKRQAS